MIYDRFLPAPALRKYIKNYEIIGLAERPTTAFEVGLFPCHRFGISFSIQYEEPQYLTMKGEIDKVKIPPTHIISPITKPYQIQGWDKFAMLAVIFWPGKLAEVFPLPQHELVNYLVAVEEIYGKVFGEIQERIKQEASLLNQCQLVDHFFLKILRNAKLKETPLLQEALWRIHRVGDAPDVAHLSKALRISSRHLHRVFRERIGFSPKTYMRILRFNRAYEILRSSAACNISEVSQLSGYYDQSHMVKEFREMFNTSPLEMLRSDPSMSVNLAWKEEEENHFLEMSGHVRFLQD